MKIIQKAALLLALVLLLSTAALAATVTTAAETIGGATAQVVYVTPGENTEIRAIIAEIPSAEELAALCEKLGAFYKPEQIGIDPALSEDMLSVSAAIRNRLPLIRRRRVLDFGE